MKLAGRWVTCGSFRRFVRDGPPAPGPLPLLRFNGKLTASPAKPELAKGKTKDKWFATDLRDAHLILHKRMLEKRARGIYDKIELTPYAIGLLAIRETGSLPEHDAIAHAHSVLNDHRVAILSESIPYSRI